MVGPGARHRARRAAGPPGEAGLARVSDSHSAQKPSEQNQAADHIGVFRGYRGDQSPQRFEASRGSFQDGAIVVEVHRLTTTERIQTHVREKLHRCLKSTFSQLAGGLAPSANTAQEKPSRSWIHRSNDGETATIAAQSTRAAKASKHSRVVSADVQAVTL
jgi:hypothetical protein